MTLGASMINELLGLNHKKMVALRDENTSMAYLLKVRKFKGSGKKRIIRKLNKKIHLEDKQPRNQNIHKNSYDWEKSYHERSTNNE